jgi:hypothetical protein
MTNREVRIHTDYNKARVQTLGLYSAFLACKAIVLRSSLQSRFTVATMFCNVGTIPSTAVMCCCSRVRGAGVAGTVAGGVEGPAIAFELGGDWDWD